VVLLASQRIGARVDGMGNTCELLKNVVTYKEPKMLAGFNQTVCGRAQRLYFPLSWTRTPPAKREALTHLVIEAEHGKPTMLLQG
jgi:hypothetical protein